MTTMTLPPLRFERPHAVGRVTQLLLPAKEHVVAEVTEIATSPRRREPLFVMDSGERYVVTARPSLVRPAGVTGVLRQNGNDPLRWLSHELLDHTTAEVAQGGTLEFRNRVAANWSRQFCYRQESTAPDGTIQEGLRPPQLGALFAIGAHWSLHRHPATVIMPTGTGKTETMLATMVAFTTGTVLVIVPSDALRFQTAKKFLSLGLLYKLGLVPPTCTRPVVGVLQHRPRTVEDLAFFDMCNVVVATAASLTQGTAAELGPQIANRVGTLIVDEAHHVAARTWGEFRTHFEGKRILQFTATPFRRDGKLVDGDVIYSYPLRRAQEDQYFKPISFEPVWELDDARADRSIAEAAIAKLRSDLQEQRNHLVMARCESIARAETVHGIYQAIAPEFSPVLVHSEAPTANADLERLKRAESRIVVCVDMLGEGFDLPQLKIAAIHDTHKSLAVLLQFAGRFTRTAGPDIGDATAIANIARQEVSSALERLYSEDADWNHLLSEASSQAVREHTELIDFLNESARLDEGESEEAIPIASALLRPKFSFAAYRTAIFRAKAFFHAIAKNQQVMAAWLNERSGTLYFVTRSLAPVQWSRSKEILDRQWDLFIVHHDPTRGLLYIHSSDKTSLHDGLAKAVTEGTSMLLYGDQVFRSLGRITRLKFQNIGVKKHGRRNLRYAMYTGADVADALSVAQRAGSTKANLSGTGFRDGEQVDVGCSYKGRIWCKDQGPIKQFISWCEAMGALLMDDTIATDGIIENVLIPQEVTAIPNQTVLALEWPHELLTQSEERVLITDGTASVPQTVIDIRFDQATANAIAFTIETASFSSQFALVVGGEGGYHVERRTGPELRIKAGRLEMPLQEYLSNYPPLVIFVDMTELDGNLLYSTTDTRELTLPADRFEPWTWTGVDIRKESMWSDGQVRNDSIQARAAEHYRAGGFGLIFDDDASGEAADLVCIKEEENQIRLALVHCKFTTSDDPGERVKDVVEVSSQAVRSGKWVADFKRLCRHITDRENRLRKPERATRYLAGNGQVLNAVVRASRFKPVKTEIVIVQPGLSQTDCTIEQTAVLAAAYSYLLETVGIPLDIVCSQ